MTKTLKAIAIITAVIVIIVLAFVFGQAHASHKETALVEKKLLAFEAQLDSVIHGFESCDTEAVRKQVEESGKTLIALLEHLKVSKH